MNGRVGIQETMLVVEDDRSLRLGLEKTLRSQGYRVRVAGTGSEGLEAALAERPDVMLLDLMLPEMNGFEVLREIRARDTELPIVILTAKGSEEDKVRGLELGADDYVVKPFGISELLARVDAQLRRKRAARSTTNTLTLGDVTVDFVAHRATRDGTELEMTALELKLLAYFVEHEGALLPRQRILDAVWGADYFGTDRTVDNFINRLRTKLEVDPKHPRFLHTIRGAGYRFERPVKKP
ncbi:MAG: response regulator transcription factor [Myxococcales bacterium]|nr:response regulator transcription factor [Myxococcales bacterium]